MVTPVGKGPGSVGCAEGRLGRGLVEALPESLAVDGSCTMPVQGSHRQSTRKDENGTRSGHEPELRDSRKGAFSLRAHSPSGSGDGPDHRMFWSIARKTSS